MRHAIAPTFNPFFALVRDAAWMLGDGFSLTQDKGRKRTYEGEFRSATLASVAALRCFANNCIYLKGEEALTSSLSDRLARVAELWHVAALSDDEVLLLQELETIEEILLNPSIAQSFDANAPGGNLIDFERTPIFQVAKQSEDWSAEYAAIALGLALRFVNHFVLERLALSAGEIAQVFGYSVRSEDGFRDILDPFRYRAAVKALAALRATVLVTQLISHRGFGPDDFVLAFIPKGDGPPPPA